MHTSMLVSGPSGLAAASCSHAGPTGSRASTAAPVCTQRQHSALRQQSIQRGHHVRRTAGSCSATDSSGQGPQDLYPNINRQHQAANGDYNGPQLVPLDVESSMGLGGTSEDIFGELAVLLVGFSREQVATFRGMMDDMEADFVPVIPVNTAMLDGTLEAAVSAALPTYQQLPEDTRHAVVMSGMSTAEVMEVIGAYSETASLPESLFGAAVPNNYGSNLRSLLAEMYDDKDYKTTQDTLEGLYQQQ